MKNGWVLCQGLGPLDMFKGMFMPGLEDVHVDSDLFGMDLPDLDVKHGEMF